MPLIIDTPLISAKFGYVSCCFKASYRVAQSAVIGQHAHSVAMVER
jgi:hypothetical protein